MLNKIYSAENTPGSAAQPAEPPAMDDLVARLSVCAPSSVADDAIAELQRQAREIADTRAMLQNTNRDAARLAHLADKYKWQVRDTCTRAERAEAERDALREVVRELVACDDESNNLAAARLYGKPHMPEYKARELDYRQRKIEAWRAARAKVKP